ncbi:hypothetical protein FRC05_005369 [Tulasnella sp. 425]|nr:hypothetical protein FRC05_005369 [Tulasnella sp. 425]
MAQSFDYDNAMSDVDDCGRKAWGLLDAAKLVVSTGVPLRILGSRSCEISCDFQFRLLPPPLLKGPRHDAALNSKGGHTRQAKLASSTRSSPSPPPTPKIRPRVFSGSRPSKPRLIPQNSYLASASSNADYSSSSDSETEAEAHGIRVFHEDRPQTKDGRLSPVRDQSDSSARHPGPAILPQSLLERRLPEGIMANARTRRGTMSAGSRTVQLRNTSAIFNERIVIPLVSTGRRPIDFVVDVRRGGEAFLLLAAVALAVRRLCQDGFVESGLRSVVLELLVLCAMALVHPVLGAIQSNAPITSPVIRPADQRRHLSPPASVPQDREMAFLWMTDARDYRECPDDGAVTSLLFVPVVAATLLHVGLLQAKDAAADINPIPWHWLISLSRVLPDSPHRPTFSRIQSLILARRNLVHLSTLCSFVLFCHLAASRWSRWRSGCKSQHDSIPSQALRPKAEGRRNFLYAQFSIGMVALALALRNMSEVLDMGLWQDLTYLDTALISFAYQFIIYVMVRLARRGFTLGELGLVAQGATALFMESVALTTAQIWPITTRFIRTYRSPTPLLVFQIALIPGAFLTGFLLSPLLVLSRNLAQKPLHRLRHPEQKVMFRRALAVGFYGLSGLIIGGLIGSWTGWCLALEQSSTILHFMRDPWLWVVRCVLEGRRPWSRPALLIYWAALASISVAGWSRQLARARKTGKKVVGVQAVTGLSSPVTAVSTSSSYQNVLSAVGSGPRPQVRPASREEPSAVSPTTTNFSPPPTAVPSSMTELLDAADKRVPILTLNGRRKFFHALAVVMFVPGIASDPAFCHLAFSAAFALFIFVEYVRYFALYPFSAQVHVFMNEFIDDKDSGTAILSHFYLLTGCAGPIWLEGPSKLLEYTGVLTLGIGDAMASIVGKRWGRHQWTSNSPKTVEGSLAFTVSVVTGAWALRVVGLVEPFSTLRYTFAVILSSVLEALSLQNDNLTLPFYMWSLLILLKA